MVIIFFAAAMAAANPVKVRAQSGEALPKVWNDAAAELADKVAAMVSPAHPVYFEFMNVSGVGAASAEAAKAALEAQLAQHHFRFTRSANVEAALWARLAESSESYVLTVEIRQKDTADADREVAIVTVGKSALGNEGSGGATVTLKSQLLWKQPKRFLDFRAVGASGSDLAMLYVLEPGRVDVYQLKNSEWELLRKDVIARSKPWPRDVRGYFKPGDEKTAALMPGISCVEANGAGATLKCDPGLEELPATGTTLPGIETGDAVDVGLSCGDARVVVASGIGDWTQPDSLQGYLARKGGAVASGAAVAFDGPVVSLVQDAQGGSAGNVVRAVVKNLKTGIYEGYLVTASCSQ